RNATVILFGVQSCDEDLIGDFFGQYYRGVTDIPKLILVEQLPADVQLLREWLTKLAGHAVKIETRQRGEGYQRLQMAKSNAAETICLRTSGTAKDVIALEEFGKALGMEKPPVYIEAYDISNLSSTAMVAGMVVFENGRPLKKAYKRFSIRDTAIQNDYACMAEVLRRRFEEYHAAKDEGFARLPDLILLDGGKGQVGAVLPELNKLGITVPVFGMVKDNRHRTRAIATGGGEISLSSRQEAFRLVTRIQDEVHRFSVAYMHSKHKKSSYTMALTEVRGIGEKKAQKLLLRYKTKVDLQAASVEELAAAAGVSQEIAAALYQKIQEL
ncbi:MAG: excinuclease ABC subunit UvrC, partial [Ruminococcus sp.]|nr:excinuclease ABC subunit UvrC [Ruminococcus sp.]